MGQPECETCAAATCWRPPSSFCFPLPDTLCIALDAHKSFYNQEYQWPPRTFWRMCHFHLPTTNKAKLRISLSCFTGQAFPHWILGNLLVSGCWSLKRKGWKTCEAMSLQRTYLITVCWFIRLTSQRNVSKGEKGQDVKSLFCPPTFLSI